VSFETAVSLVDGNKDKSLSFHWTQRLEQDFPVGYVI